MHDAPTFPPVDSAPEVVDSGHLWLYELVDAAPMRVGLADAGYLQFGDDERVFDEIPLPYRFATTDVEERVDYAAFQEAVDAAGPLTLVGWATRFEGTTYDWERIPPFLALAVIGDEGALAPDVAEKVVEGVGLDAVPTVAREVPTRDFHPGGYDLPASNYRDGPVRGVVVRNKHGGWARVDAPANDEGERPSPIDRDADEVAADLATRETVERVATRLRDRGEHPTVDAVLDRLVEGFVRREYARLYRPRPVVEPAAIRSAAAPLVRDLLAGG